MRVKLLIALAIASIFLLVSSLPAGAIGVTGPSGTTINVAPPNFSPVVPPVSVVPCVSFLAVNAPTVAPFGALAPVTLASPALQTAITLSPPGAVGFTPPGFVLSQLSPPAITPFTFTAPAFFDP